METTACRIHAASDPWKIDKNQWVFFFTHLGTGPVSIQLGIVSVVKSLQLGILHCEMRQIGKFYVKFIITVFASTCIGHWELLSFLY